MNEELGQALVKSLPSDSAIFFECDVTDTDSVSSAVTKSAEWAKKIGKDIGGVIAAAGVANPGMISSIRNLTTCVNLRTDQL